MGFGGKANDKTRFITIKHTDLSNKDIHNDVRIILNMLARLRGYPLRTAHAHSRCFYATAHFHTKLTAKNRQN